MIMREFDLDAVPARVGRAGASFGRLAATAVALAAAILLGCDRGSGTTTNGRGATDARATAGPAGGGGADSSADGGPAGTGDDGGTGATAGGGSPLVEAPPALTSSFPAVWFWTDQRTKKRPPESIALEGRPAPELTVQDWIGDPATIASLRGSIVVVYFWMTTPDRIMRTIGDSKRLLEHYGAYGVRVIGVHNSRKGWDSAEAAVKEYGINFPIAVDVDTKTEKAYHAFVYPHYTVIDRDGILRASGVLTSRVGDVIEAILKAEAEAEGRTWPPR
jgi:peroxiredoxin